MKIVIAGLISPALFFIIVGCASNHVQNEDSKKIFGFLIGHSVKLNHAELSSSSVLEIDDDRLVLQSGAERTVKIITNQFSDRKQAVQHMMTRRVALTAIFRDKVEPYYGLVEKRKCVDVSQPSSDFKDESNNTSFSMIFPADKLLNLFDCDKGEPPMYVQYTLILCTRTLNVFEIRDYQSSKKSFSRAPIILCD